MNLYPHQARSLDYTYKFNRCAYYLDMGLGKTFVGSEKMNVLKKKINLVICQKSKVEDWVKHFKTYYLKSLILDLTNKYELEMFEIECNMKCKSYDQLIGVINYDLVWRRSNLLKVEDFTLMLDESSLIGNDTAKRTKFILKMKPTNVILLSGTPCSGKYENLWTQCKLLGWDISKAKFYNNYIITRQIDVGGFYKDIVVGYRNVNDLKLELKKHGAIFMKAEEVMDLPDQVDQQIYVNQNPYYKMFKKDLYVKIDDIELVGDTSLTKILYERQLCGAFSKEKMQAFKDLIDSTNDRLVVFYNFNNELFQLKEIVGNSRPISIINGQTKDLSAYEESDNSITFVQYQAGAMGLNLQKANKIIYFTLPLGKGSSGLWEQSKKRIHRIGQSKTCFYYYLLVKDSIEEWNLSLLREGKELTDALFTQNKHN